MSANTVIEFSGSGTTSPRLGRLSRAGLLALGVLALAGLIAWVNQLFSGLRVTGMKSSTSWGIYIANFVFFIGISHAGTLISAVLRITRAEWRRPITRIAEAVTVFALLVGAVQVIVDLGRPDRMFRLVVSGRLGSPLLWDVICISTYFLCSIVYLWLPLIPDVDVLSRREDLKPWRRRLYRALAGGFIGKPAQRQRLERAIGFMAVLIIPVMICVHTVVSWIFGMTVRSMWHSTILGPYFVTGAIFSGVAVVILAMAAVRRAKRLEAVVKPVIFENLSRLLLVMCGLWFYFTVAELLTTGYGGLTGELTVLNAKMYGDFALVFWFTVFCMAAALVVLVFRSRRLIPSVVVASSLIVVGMWLERFMVIVPTLTRAAEEGYRAGLYSPTVTEWLVTAGSISLFLLLYIGFLRIFPAISMWELEAGHAAVSTTAARLQSYLPDRPQPAGEDAS